MAVALLGTHHGNERVFCGIRTRATSFGNRPGAAIKTITQLVETTRGRNAFCMLILVNTMNPHKIYRPSQSHNPGQQQWTDVLIFPIHQWKYHCQISVTLNSCESRLPKNNKLISQNCTNILTCVPNEPTLVWNVCLLFLVSLRKIYCSGKRH